MLFGVSGNRQHLESFFDAVAEESIPILDDLRHVLSSFPGEAEVVLDMRTAGGRRRLRLGPDYRVAPSAGLRAELDALLTSAAAAPA